jgi:hypothetical protein
VEGDEVSGPDPTGIFSKTEYDMAEAAGKVAEVGEMRDDLKVIEALHGGFEAAMAEVSRQVWYGCTEGAPAGEPEPLTMEKLKEAMALIPRRPSLELALVLATSELTENELEILVGVVKQYVGTMIEWRTPEGFGI